MSVEVFFFFNTRNQTERVRLKLAKLRAARGELQQVVSQSAEWLHLLPLEWTMYWLYSVCEPQWHLLCWIDGGTFWCCFWLAVKGCDLPATVRNFWPRFKKGAAGHLKKKKGEKKAFISHTFIYVWQPAYAFFRPRSYRPAQNCSHRSKYLYRCRQMQAAEREGRLTVKGGINSLGVEVMNNRDYHRCWQWRREAVTAAQSNRAPLGKKRDEEDDTKVCPVWW